MPPVRFMIFVAVLLGGLAAPTSALAQACEILDAWPTEGATGAAPNRRRIFLRSSCPVGTGTLTADGAGDIETSLSSRRLSSRDWHHSFFLPDTLEVGSLHRFDIDLELPDDIFNDMVPVTWSLQTATEPAEAPVLDDLVLERFEIVQADGAGRYRLEVEGSWPGASTLARLDVFHPRDIYEVVFPAAQSGEDGHFEISRPFKMPPFKNECAVLSVEDDGAEGGRLLRQEACASRGCSTAPTPSGGIGLLLGLLGLLGLTRRNGRAG